MSDVVVPIGLAIQVTNDKGRFIRLLLAIPR